MLAVKVDYQKRTATIGTKKGSQVPRDEILAALNKIRYQGKFLDEPSVEELQE